MLRSGAKHCSKDGLYHIPLVLGVCDENCDFMSQ